MLIYNPRFGGLKITLKSFLEREYDEYLKDFYKPQCTKTLKV